MKVWTFPRRGDRNALRGVTLLELVLVMGVIVLLAGVVVPRFSDSFPALQVRKAADRLYARAQRARADAALSGGRNRLVFDPDERTYWVEFEPRPFKEPGVFLARDGQAGGEPLPGETTFEELSGLDPHPLDARRRVLEFRPDGTSLDARLVLSNNWGDRRALHVEAATGRILFEEAVAR